MSQGLGNIGTKSVEFVVGSDSIVTLTHSLTHSLSQNDSIVAYGYEAVSHKIKHTNKQRERKQKHGHFHLK